MSVGAGFAHAHVAVNVSKVGLLRARFRGQSVAAVGKPHLRKHFSQPDLPGQNQFVRGIRESKIHHHAGKQEHAKHSHQNTAIGNGDVRNLKGGFSLLRHCFEKCGELPVGTDYHNLRRPDGIPNP